MRLIDAEEFKKQIAGMAIINNYPPEKANQFCELIDLQKTAYDLDKVIEQLEELHETISCDDWYAATKVYHAIEIVKQGRNIGNEVN